jgi:alanine racemase
VIATLPIGYGDGWRRAFSDNAEVLIGGRRCPLVGRVSMDNVTVDVGPDPAGIAEGDEAVLLGRDGEDRITAEELARRIDTINYEITTALTARPTRVYA